MAGIVGFLWNRTLEHHQQRIVDMLRRQRARLYQRRQADKVLSETERNRWLLQAMGWATNALLVLDGSQHIVMANPAAMDHFKLSPHVLGSHWLDHVGSPEWAAALRRSIENPGLRVSGPPSTHALPVVLLTFSRPEVSIPESTWITIG